MNQTTNTPELNTKTVTGRPLILGEVLFDSFPDGNHVLGGAPFNVAWHLHGFGLNPLFISRIGQDELGDKILTSLSEWEMDTTAVQQDTEHPTGEVTVTLDENNQPEYKISENQAYDFVDIQATLNSLNNDTFSLLYHGSLILRTDHSKNVLEKLIQQYSIPIFVDLNLREPWWEDSLIEQIIPQATWLKINDSEFTVLNKNEAPEKSLCNIAKSLCKQFDLTMLLLTLGSRGAFITTNTKLIRGMQIKPKDVIDRVGAGDAFSAVVITGIIKGWHITTILQRALDFATDICNVKGAVSNDKELYSSHLACWHEEDNV